VQAHPSLVQPQELDAQVSSVTQSMPTGQPLVTHPTGGGGVHPVPEQMFPMQQLGEGGSHQQKAPA